MEAGTGIKKENYIAVVLFLSGGVTRNRTGDTRIFSPLLFFGIRKLADAHFWMQPTELLYLMNQ